MYENLAYLGRSKDRSLATQLCTVGAGMLITRLWTRFDISLTSQSWWLIKTGSCREILSSTASEGTALTVILEVKGKMLNSLKMKINRKRTSIGSVDGEGKKEQRETDENDPQLQVAEETEVKESDNNVKLASLPPHKTVTRVGNSSDESESVSDLSEYTDTTFCVSC